MGESSARSGGRRNGTAPPGATTAQHDWPRTDPGHSEARFRYSSSMDRNNHHGSRSQGTPAHPAGRSDPESQAGRRSRASDSALAWRRDHDTGCFGPALPAHGTTHRRGYDLAATPFGGSLSG